MRRTTNPILKGFNPDPSICRVGDDYYIATSTFEWYPGVQIHHSRNLKDWRLVARPLNRPDLLNMLGSPDSCGVWAPCLTYSDGRFWLLYTDVKRFDGNFKDTHNYLTSSPTIDGDWDEPVNLNSSGFDPSLFHDDDGRKWYLNMIWDHRADRSFFRGIVMQEYDAEARQLVGKPGIIFEGTEIGYTEGPHLYRHNGYYYLLTAEGGTGYGHAVSMARSRNIGGPYEADPSGPVVTARDDPDWPLQKAGHGDIVETASGEFYLVHLVGRPLPGTRRCPLGRETALQKLEYTDDGWFRLAGGGSLPALECELPDLPKGAPAAETARDDFDTATLDPVWQWLRSPWPDEFMSLRERPGYLRLKGRESPGSLFRQALVARRQVDFAFAFETEIEFEPRSFQQMAGLIVYYNARKFHYFYVSTGSAHGKHLAVMSCEADPSLAVMYPLGDSVVPLEPGAPVKLRASVDGAILRFAWALAGEAFNDLGIELDQSLLSDETGVAFGEQFTGAFVGLACHDVTGMNKHADFAYASYESID